MITMQGVAVSKFISCLVNMCDYYGWAKNFKKGGGSEMIQQEKAHWRPEFDPRSLQGRKR